MQGDADAPEPTPPPFADTVASLFGPTLVGLGLFMATGSPGLALGGGVLLVLVLLGRDMGRLAG